ncbi:MAG: GspE/PulE family protein [Bdellovibrionales bacterium]|nr:GspE/PulE family protein [Bdellovibrionales bacterium]
MSQEELLNSIIHAIHESDSFRDVMEIIEPPLLKLLAAERVTVYSKGRSDREIVSTYRSGEELKEIRVPLSPKSLAGYVALSKKELLVKDVYNETELIEIHDELRFNKSFDEKSGFRTQSVLAVPIVFKGTFLGVLQALNSSRLAGFTDRDVETANRLATFIAQKLRYDFKGTSGPFEHLVQSNRIRAEELDQLKSRAEQEGTSVQHLLMSEAGVSKNELGESLSRFYQVPFASFEPHHVIPPALMEGINLAYLRQSVWVPIEGNRDDAVVVLIDDPSDAQRVMEIQRSFRAKSYEFRVALKEDILRYLGENTSASKDSADVHALLGKLQEEVSSEEIIDAQEFEEAGEDEATVIQLVNKIIIDSYMGRASDIHIEPGKGKANATVRIRVDGSCRALLSIPSSHVRAVVSRVKIISGLDISERRKPQDGKCVVRFRGNPIELRVATVPTVHGESVVMRILASSDPLPLEKLNLSERNIKVIKHITSQPHGVFLVVGPTGSGKTTTLHAILGSMNTPDRKIWTAEDPVEITQSGLQQVQMKPEIGLTFASSLRAFLRADPDVIMIGEMRDYETAHIGIEASLTGHFVFSTLHTNSAPETITRLLDLKLDPVSFSDALQGVLAQRLVRTLCENCKEAYSVPEEEYVVLQRYYGEQHFSELNFACGKSQIYRPKGCDKCGNTGYRGRTGIHELLLATPSIKTLIYESAPANEIKKLAVSEGMRTLMQDGIRKLTIGQTDLSQIRKVAGSDE